MRGGRTCSASACRMRRGARPPIWNCTWECWATRRSWPRMASVFAHVHPSGSVPMAALALAQGRANPHAEHMTMAGGTTRRGVLSVRVSQARHVPYLRADEAGRAGADRRLYHESRGLTLEYRQREERFDHRRGPRHRQTPGYGIRGRGGASGTAGAQSGRTGSGQTGDRTGGRHRRCACAPMCANRKSWRMRWTACGAVSAGWTS